jgi:hypothetical protein
VAVVLRGEEPAEGDADELVLALGDDAEVARPPPVTVIARELRVLES